jgi:phosphate starvation-inducible PhoH-like protein
LSRKVKQHQPKKRNYHQRGEEDLEHTPRKKDIRLVPRSINQEDYINVLLNNEIPMIFATGPAGCGKTYLAALAAVKLFIAGDFDKLVFVRPAVSVDDEKFGFLPGKLDEKVAPWVRPLFDALGEIYSPPEIKKMMENEVIELAPMAMMRGRTFKNSLILADEMQNSTPSQMKMILTRLGEGSRMFVTGDLKQADRTAENNGLLDFNKLCAQFGDSEYVSWVHFAYHDIERHPAVREILRIYKESDQ